MLCCVTYSYVISATNHHRLVAAESRGTQKAGTAAVLRGNRIQRWWNSVRPHSTSLQPLTPTYLGPWAPTGMGKGALASPWKCCTVFCTLVVTVKGSVDELFMHYFYNLPPRLHPWTPLGDFRPQTHSLSTPGKNFAAPMPRSLTSA